MAKYADYIQRIEIDALWGGRKHIVWQLNPHVNILSGINGVGKSTILNKVVRQVDSLRPHPLARLQPATDAQRGRRFH